MRARRGGASNCRALNRGVRRLCSEASESFRDSSECSRSRMSSQSKRERGSSVVRSLLPAMRHTGRHEHPGRPNHQATRYAFHYLVGRMGYSHTAHSAHHWHGGTSSRPHSDVPSVWSGTTLRHSCGQRGVVGNTVPTTHLRRTISRLAQLEPACMQTCIMGGGAGGGGGRGGGGGAGGGRF